MSGIKAAIVFVLASGVVFLDGQSAPKAQTCDPDSLQAVMDSVPPFIPVPPGVDPNDVLNTAFGCEVMPTSPSDSDAPSADSYMSSNPFGIGETVVGSGNETFGVIVDWLIDGENTAQYALVERELYGQENITATVALPAGFVTFDQFSGPRLEAFVAQNDDNVELFSSYNFIAPEDQYRTLSGINQEELEMQPIYFERIQRGIQRAISTVTGIWNPPHILISVESQPDGAGIFLGGKFYGNTVLLAHVDKRKFASLIIEKDGYRPCGPEEAIFADSQTTPFGHLTFYCELQKF